MPRSLTPKQLKAIDVYVEGNSKSEAYRQAYNCENSSPATINARAFELFELPKVTAEVSRLQGELRMTTKYTRATMVEDLASIVQDYKTYKEMAESVDLTNNAAKDHVRILTQISKATDALAAIKQMTKLLGLDTPEKIEVDHSVTININKPKES